MNALRSIAIVGLALLVLVSSTSFMVGMHRCKGEIRDMAFFSKAEACESERTLPPCHRHVSKPCCDDAAIVHEGDDFKASAAHVQAFAPAPADIPRSLILISELIPSATRSRTDYPNYDPPLRSVDLTVEHQVFLI